MSQIYATDITLSFLGDDIIPIALFIGSAGLIYFMLDKWQGELNGINDPTVCYNWWAKWAADYLSYSNSTSQDAITWTNKRDYYVKQNFAPPPTPSTGTLGFFSFLSKKTSELSDAPSVPAFCNPMQLGIGSITPGMFPNFMALYNGSCQPPCASSNKGPCPPVTYETDWDDGGSNPMRYTPCTLYRDSLGGCDINNSCRALGYPSQVGNAIGLPNTTTGQTGYTCGATKVKLTNGTTEYVGPHGDSSQGACMLSQGDMTNVMNTFGFFDQDTLQAKGSKTGSQIAINSSTDMTTVLNQDGNISSTMQVTSVNQNMGNISLLPSNTGLGQVSTDISSVSRMPSSLLLTQQAQPYYPSYGVSGGAFSQQGNITNTYFDQLYGGQVSIHDQNPVLYRGPYNDPVKGDDGLTWFHYDPVNSPDRLCTPYANDTKGFGWYDRSGAGFVNARGCYSLQKTIFPDILNGVGQQEEAPLSNDITHWQKPSVWTAPLYTGSGLPFSQYSPTWVVGAQVDFNT
jgi:hypothetical protein